MAVRRLDHLDVVDGGLVGLGSHPGWAESAAEGQDPAAPPAEPSVALWDCRIVLSRVAVAIDLAPGVEALPEPPLRVVLPRASGLLWGLLTEMRGGPRHFTAPVPQPWYWSNRRSGYRVPLAEPAPVRLGQRELRATYADISISGARLHLPLPANELRPGDRLCAMLPVPGELWVDARAVRVEAERQGCVVGVAWVDVPDRADQRLASFVFARERQAAARKR